MTANFQMSTTLRNARLDTITSSVGSAGLLRIYDNSAGAPASVGAAVTGVKLAEFTLSSPFGPSATGAVLSPTIPAQVNAVATGTALYYRVYKSDGTTAVIQDTVGTSSAGMVMNTTSIVTGGPVVINSWTIGENGA